MKSKLKVLNEYEEKGKTRAPWLEKLEPAKAPPKKQVIMTKQMKANQIAARKRSQELNEARAFRDQAKRNKQEIQKAMSQELAQEYIKKRDAWKKERENAKIKLLQSDVGDVSDIGKQRHVHWKDELVSIHHYVKEPDELPSDNSEQSENIDDEDSL